MKRVGIGRGGHWLESALLVFGLSCLAWCAIVLVRSALYQRELKATLGREVAESEKRESAPLAPPSMGPLDLIGELTIPRLNLSAFVVEGDDDSVLTAAVGHLPDTPLPWGSGNSGLAAHRDTFFRPLKDVRVGDRLVLSTPYGRLEYKVHDTLIVDPDDVWVLAPTSHPSLTLITCYPFTYVGHAPRRFIVRADRVAPELRPIIWRTPSR